MLSNFFSLIIDPRCTILSLMVRLVSHKEGGRTPQTKKETLNLAFCHSFAHAHGMKNDMIM